MKYDHFRFSRYALSLCAAIATMSGCGGSQAAMTGAATPHVSARSDSTGNIYWNKKKLNLPFPTNPPVKATLTYWGPNGYFTVPVSCKTNGKILVKHGHPFGNSSGYMKVVYSFKTLMAGPNECGFSAVLSGTGSPPVAVIKLYIERK
jgi:hypothetical protein